MEEKYYTPEIEEFHYGFEYEIIPSTGFSIIDFSSPESKIETHYATKYIKCKYGVQASGIFDGGLPTICEAIRQNKCRVKHLAKDDIESLGWELKFEEIKTYSHWVEYKKGDLTLSLQLKKVGKNYPNHCNFKGKYNTNIRLLIKNKSELKKIMQQAEFKTN